MAISPLAAVLALCFAIIVASRLPLKYSPSMKRLGCVDGLRGILALCVYFHHYVITYCFFLSGKWESPSSSFYTILGEGSVALFFMITGFLFSYKIINYGEEQDWRRLYISRFFRLVPLYWFVVFLVILIVSFNGGFHLHEHYSYFLKNCLSWFLFFGMPDINRFAETGRIIAYVAWTLQYEWIFYFSLPFLAVLFRISKKLPFLLFFIVVVLCFWTIKPFIITVFNVSSAYFIYFIPGVLAAYLYKHERLRLLFQKEIFSIICFISLGILFAFFNKGFGMVQLILLAIFFIPIALGNSIFGFLKVPSILVLGEISYSIYLLHGILLFSFVNSFGLYSCSLINSSLVVIGMSLLGTVLVPFSYLTFLLVEQPGRECGKCIGMKVENEPK